MRKEITPIHQSKSWIYAVMAIACMLMIFSAPAEAQIRQSYNKAKGAVNRTRRGVNRVKRAMGSKKRKYDPSKDTTDVIVWSRDPYIPNSGMIRDYEHIYTFFHTAQQETFKLDPDLKAIGYDSINGQFVKSIGNNPPLDTKYEVMGWHPYWMEDAYKYYNYNLLSIISYYSYDINPYTGGYANSEVIDSLSTSGLLDSVRNNNTKLFLSVTSFGGRKNHEFLNNDMAIEYFQYQLLEILRSDTVFKGIDLNFEEIQLADKDKFTSFVRKTNARLKSEGYMMVLNVPYFNNNSIFDYEELNGNVTYFNIMGYDFSGEHSSYPGSISPLQGHKYQPTLQSALNDLLIANIAPDDIIVSLPLYGVSWDIVGDDTFFYESSIPYFQVKANYASEYSPPYYDALSSSFFYHIVQDDFTRICWFENETSLDIKFKWAKENGLKGVGLWALGYEQGSPEIWETVANNFQADSLVAVQSIATSLNGPYGIVKDIITYKKVIGFGFMVFSGFILLGFILSLTDWRVRDILFKNQSFRIIYMILAVVLITLSSNWWLSTGGEWDLEIGLGIGVAVVLLVNYLFSLYRKALR